MNYAQWKDTEDYYKLKSTPPTPGSPARAGSGFARDGVEAPTKTQQTGPANPPVPAVVTPAPAQKAPAPEPLGSPAPADVVRDGVKAKTIVDQVTEFIARYL